jgi:hypothetical protein
MVKGVCLLCFLCPDKGIIMLSGSQRQISVFTDFSGDWGFEFSLGRNHLQEAKLLDFFLLFLRGATTKQTARRRALSKRRG